MSSLDWMWHDFIISFLTGGETHTETSWIETDCDHTTDVMFLMF